MGDTNMNIHRKKFDGTKKHILNYYSWIDDAYTETSNAKTKKLSTIMNHENDIPEKNRDTNLKIPKNIRILKDVNHYKNNLPGVSDHPETKIALPVNIEDTELTCNSDKLHIYREKAGGVEDGKTWDDSSYSSKKSRELVRCHGDKSGSHSQGLNGSKRGQKKSDTHNDKFIVMAASTSDQSDNNKSPFKKEKGKLAKRPSSRVKVLIMVDSSDEENEIEKNKRRRPLKKGSNNLSIKNKEGQNCPEKRGHINDQKDGQDKQSGKKKIKFKSKPYLSTIKASSLSDDEDDEVRKEYLAYPLGKQPAKHSSDKDLFSSDESFSELHPINKDKQAGSSSPAKSQGTGENDTKPQNNQFILPQADSKLYLYNEPGTTSPYRRKGKTRPKTPLNERELEEDAKYRGNDEYGNKYKTGVEGMQGDYAKQGPGGIISKRHFTVKAPRSATKMVCKKRYHIKIPPPGQPETWFNVHFNLDDKNNVNMNYEGPVKIINYYTSNNYK